MDRSDFPEKEPPRPVEIDEEEDEKKRARSSGAGDASPAHAQLGANIRPDVVSAPSGLHTVTTQKSKDYRPDLAAGDYVAEELAAADRELDTNDGRSEMEIRYAEEVLHGIREARRPEGQDAEPRLSVVAEAHFTYEHALQQMPPLDGPPVPFETSGVARPAAYDENDPRFAPFVTAAGHTVAYVQASQEQYPETWGTSPLDGAMRREARTDGHEQNPDGADSLRPVTLGDIVVDPWNAVAMSLPSDAPPRLREVALQAAIYCAAGERELTQLIRSGEHTPQWFSDAVEAGDYPCDAHEVAEGNWLEALGTAENIIRFNYRDLSTLTAAEGVMTRIPDSLDEALRELNDSGRTVIEWRNDLVEAHEAFLTDRESALGVIERQAEQESTQRQENERRASAGEDLNPVASAADYVVGELRAAEKEGQFERDAEHDQAPGREPGDGRAGRGSGRDIF